VPLTLQRESDLPTLERWLLAPLRVRWRPDAGYIEDSEKAGFVRHSIAKTGWGRVVLMARLAGSGAGAERKSP
jgi:hypothetical protein